MYEPPQRSSVRASITKCVRIRRHARCTSPNIFKGPTGNAGSWSLFTWALEWMESARVVTLLQTNE